MTRLNILLAAGAVCLTAAAPAAAQYYPQPTYPQPAPGQPGYNPQAGYGQPAYGYNQQGGLGAVIGQLLGNRYNVNDRTAVQQCATAAMAQAANQYRTQPYGNAYGYNNQGYQQGYNPAAAMRVTAITNVERRNNGLDSPFHGSRRLRNVDHDRLRHRHRLSDELGRRLLNRRLLRRGLLDPARLHRWSGFGGSGRLGLGRSRGVGLFGAVLGLVRSLCHGLSLAVQSGRWSLAALHNKHSSNARQELLCTAT